MNTFITTMQTIASNDHNGSPSVWETLISIHYDDFILENVDIEIRNSMCEQFEENLNQKTSFICGIRDTAQVTSEQGSEVWMQARWPLVTASDSKSAYIIGEKVLSGNPPLAQISNLLNNKL